MQVHPPPAPTPSPPKMGLSRGTRMPITFSPFLVFPDIPRGQGPQRGYGEEKDIYIYVHFFIPSCKTWVLEVRLTVDYLV